MSARLSASRLRARPGRRKRPETCDTGADEDHDPRWPASPWDHRYGACTSIEDARDHLKGYLATGGHFVDTAHR